MSQIRRILTITAIGVAGLTGCRLIKQLPGLPRNQDTPPPPITSSAYHLETWSWEPVARVLVLPPYNTSTFTKAGEEFQAAMASELQRLGRFEVIQAPPESLARLSETIHRTGRFDEVVMFELAKEARAEIIICTTISQYSPYPRPRAGLVVQAISPLDGKVVSSIDGLWDTSDSRVGEAVRRYYRQRQRPVPAWIRNHTIANDDNFTAEIALDSPALFQRWICHLCAYELIGEMDEDTMQLLQAKHQKSGKSHKTSPKCPPDQQIPSNCQTPQTNPK